MKPSSVQHPPTFSTQQKITIKQFQWYQVQTKVREIMGQLLQPFNKKQTQQSLKINDLKRNFALALKRIDDHDFLLSQENATKPKYIELQDEKIEQLNKIIQKNSAQYNMRLKSMQVTIQVYKQKITQLNDVQKRIDQEIINRVKNFTQFKDTIQNSINLMTKRLQNVLQENNLIKSQVRNSLNKMENKMLVYQNRVKQLEDELKRKGNDIKRLMDCVSDHNQKIKKAQLKLYDLSSRIDDKQKDTKLSQKFYSKVKQVQNDLLFLHKYLQSYQPLYTQLQISQTLSSLVKGKQKRQLCVWEQKKYASYHNHILMNDSLTLEDLMKNYSESIRKLINRNRKYIVNLKVQESIKYGMNVYDIRIQDQDFKGDQNQENKKQVHITIPQQQIQKILQKRWQNMQQSIKQKINQTLQPTTQWMKQLQQQSFFRFSKIQSEIQNILNEKQKLKADIELKDTVNNKEISRIKQVNGENVEKIQLIRSYIKDILNFNSVLNHIVIQDEIDRQGVTLYAFKTKQLQAKYSSPQNNSTQKLHSTIQLDPNCLSCQNDQKAQNIIQQTFKMACLTYNPSEIKIDDQYFSRQQILEISTNILQRLKKKMDQKNTGGLQKILNNNGLIHTTGLIYNNGNGKFINNINNNFNNNNNNYNNFNSLNNNIKNLDINNTQNLYNPKKRSISHNSNTSKHSFNSIIKDGTKYSNSKQQISLSVNRIQGNNMNLTEINLIQKQKINNKNLQTLLPILGSGRKDGGLNNKNIKMYSTISQRNNNSNNVRNNNNSSFSIFQ